MSSSILRIAVSGLQAAQAGLATTGHNIANANTPGFSRQEAIQQNRNGLFTGSGYLGRGVDVATVIRRYDNLLTAQARSAQSAASHFSALEAQASAIDNLLADPEMGLAPALAEFFAGVNTLASHPGDAAARQAMLSSAEALASRMHLLDGSLANRQAGIDRRIETTVASVNELSRQIAELNDRVGRESAAGQPPNDLLDRRDALIRDLSALTSATAVAQSDGSLNIFMANGQALVVGSTAFQLRAAPDRFDPARRVVGLVAGSGFVEFTADTLFGGELGGLLAARRDVLDPAQNELGRVAIALADAFNAQHRLGQDRTGAPGGDFFTIASPWTGAATTNTGNAQLTAAFSATGALTGSDYDVRFDAGGWTLTRLSDGTSQVFATLPATLDGVTLDLGSGAPAVGDRYLLRPTRDGAGGLGVFVTDPLRIAAGAPVRTAATSTNLGSGAISPGVVNALDPNLAQPVTITFTAAGTFSVSGTGTGNPAGLAYTPGMSLSYNGWQVTLSGQPAPGDSFTVVANAGGVGDNRNALALAALQTARIVGGASSANEAYGALVAAVGSSTHEASLAARSQGALSAEADIAVERVSGVNLDEEAANLLKFQQAYQAAGKVIQTAAAMFDTLISITSR